MSVYFNVWIFLGALGLVEYRWSGWPSKCDSLNQPCEPQIVFGVTRSRCATGETKSHHGRVFHVDWLTTDILREPVNFANWIVQQLLNHVERMNPVVNQFAAASMFGIREPGFVISLACQPCLVGDPDHANRRIRFADFFRCDQLSGFLKRRG